MDVLAQEWHTLLKWYNRPLHATTMGSLEDSVTSLHVRTCIVPLVPLVQTAGGS